MIHSVKDLNKQIMSRARGIRVSPRFCFSVVLFLPSLFIGLMMDVQAKVNITMIETGRLSGDGTGIK